MSQGRGSAARTACIAVALLCLVAHSEHVVQAATYTVGNQGGWTFNMANWPHDKHFRAGDTLVFKYSPIFHNVVAVDRAGYNSCRTSRGARVLKSGNDQVKLAKGWNYFICNFPGHCESQMKIAVNAV